jgi:ATP synthase protein I
MSKPSPLIQHEFPVGLVLVQACIIPCAALLAWQLYGVLAAKSAALGALIGWLGSGYAAWKSFRFGGSGQLMLAGFYQGVIGKFVIVIAGFFIVFRTVNPLSAGALFTGFAVVQAMAWAYPVWLGHASKKS